MGLPPAVQDLDTESVRSQNERILADPLFHDCPIQRRLLQYLVDETLAGNERYLKELNIGNAVFRRGADYDPRTDSVVRVQIGGLRKRLATYYAGSGAGDTVVIEVPRGHYVPHFSRRAESKEEPVENPGAPPAAPRRRVHALGYISVGIAAGVALVLLAQMWTRASTHNQAAQSGYAAEWRSHPLWKGFFDPGSQTQLVVGVPFLMAMDGVVVRDTLVNSPEELTPDSRISRIARLLDRPAEPVEFYTGMGEMAGGNRLAAFFMKSSRDLHLVRSRLARWQDLTTDNLIFLSSTRFRTLNQRLDLPADFVFDGAPGRGPAFRNLRPLPGEAADYACSLNGNAGTTYSTVTLWPGTVPGRRIMSISGVQTWGTEGAAQYATDAPSLRELRKKIEDPARPAPADAAGLQVLLQVKVQDSQVASVTYITHHWIKKRAN